MHLRTFVVIAAAAVTVALAGCSSDDETTPPPSFGASETMTSVTDPEPTDIYSGRCPTEEAPASTPVDWVVAGATGKAEVAGQTPTHGPLIRVTTPFSVYETQFKTLKSGDGPVVTDESTVSICYQGVDGRTGDTFDSTYEKGQPISMAASGVVPGFRRALVGQKVGSTVAVVIPPADGYPDGTPDGSIRAGDSIVFAVKIVAAAEGTGVY